MFLYFIKLEYSLNLKDVKFLTYILHMMRLARLDYSKPDSPVVIYALDNSCFMNMSSDGTISPIKKLPGRQVPRGRRLSHHPPHPPQADVRGPGRDREAMW